MQDWIRIAWYASVAAQAAVLSRLLLSRLAASFPWFTAFILLSVARSAALLSIGWTARQYPTVWALTDPIILALQVAAYFECWRLITRRFPDSYSSIGATVFGILVAAAMLLSFAGTPIDVQNSHWRWIAQLMIARRYVLGAAALFMLLSWVVELVPAPISPNLRIHRRVLAIHVITLACLQLAGNALKSVVDVANVAQLWLSAACWTAWAVLVSRAGQETGYATPSKEEGAAAWERVQDIADGLSRINGR